MRISDWSSDVCSSDLAENDLMLAEFNARNGEALDALINKHNVQLKRFSDDMLTKMGEAAGRVVAQVGQSDAQTKKVYEDRKSVVKGKRVSVRVDLGGRRIIKKHKKNNKRNNTK